MIHLPIVNVLEPTMANDPNMPQPPEKRLMMIVKIHATSSERLECSRDHHPPDAGLKALVAIVPAPTLNRQEVSATSPELEP